MDETYAQGTPTRTLRVGNDLVRIVQEVHIAKESIDEIADAIIEKLNLPSAQPDNSCDGCRYENADDGVLVPCGFCKRSHPDNYGRKTDE